MAQSGYAVDALGLEFPILYNPGREVIREYGVFNLNGTGYTTPATFIVDRQGQIRWQYIGQYYTDRPGNRRIIQELDMLD